MKTFSHLLAVAALLLVTGCASTSDPNRPSCPEEGIIGKIPRTSPFAKVKMDMPMGQVFELLGEPTNQYTFPSSKSFSPFYFGNDEMRIEAHYKGLGRIVFSGSSYYLMQVLRVEYDPSEIGYGR